MKLLKEYYVTKESWISAAHRFREELKDLKLTNAERQKYLQEFIDAFKRSEDYDLASFRVFEHLIPSVSRAGAFKSVWENLNKQEKGDVVVWEGLKYKVEDVVDAKDGDRIYTVCRLESSNGVDLKVKCLRIKAEEDELETV